MPARKTPAKTPEEEPQEQPVIDGVFVMKTTDDQGNLSTQIVLNGSVQVTEVQTLLELAVQRFRADIGLGKV